MKSLPAVRLVFFAMAAVLVASLIAAWLVSRETLRASAEISSREANLRLVQEAFSTLQDAETGQRGYLLTGRTDYLGPYAEALDALPARLRHLRNNSARDGELPPDLVEKFVALANEKMEELARTVRLARQSGEAEAVGVVLTDEGIRKMNAIREVFVALVDHEEAHMQRGEEAARALISLRTAVFVAAAILNLAFLVWAFRRIRREVTRRHVADLEAQRHRDILAVSLSSIGDAVIITDTEARIVFLNSVAEELTGWRSGEALGKRCADVFRIINETSRATVDSPVDLVLRSGKIVGLANHTLLIRKDGTEVPIDDSGAPVREADGTVRGVVLVFRDFSQHKTAERELLALKDRLEAASEAKDEFLAALSHELRTPLTPVLATLSSWEADRSLPPHLEEDVRMLTRNVRLEARLIEDLLDLTRISRGQMTLRKEKLDAHALLAGVVGMFRHAVEPRQIRVGVRTAAERFHVEADPARLQQVFWNIVGNAVKFTPDGGRIEIVTANDGNDLRVTIADNGRGMSRETLEHLFLPFERRPTHTHYQAGGLGIGLTISQNLMLAHGGTIEAKSAGPGLGSTFVVRLPALATRPPTMSAAAGGGGNGDILLSILLVEDHADSAMVIGRIVQNMGHRVQTSATVEEALAKLREQEFDLVLSDIGLPDGTGMDLIARAREFSTTAMIALTGYGMEDDLAEYRKAGFLHELTKPIRFEQLQELLREFAFNRRKQGGLFVHPQPELPGEGTG